jgi:Helix-turn-helix domain
MTRKFEKTMQDAQGILKKSYRQIKRYIDQGLLHETIHYTFSGRTYLFSEDDLRQWLATPAHKRYLQKR